MSKPTKARSGLGSITRDWSSTSSIEEKPYHWSPSPPVVKAEPPARKLTGSEQRLKAIQDALSGMSKASSSTAPLVESKVQNKRPSLPDENATGPAPKRARQLPPDWHRNDSLSKSSFSSKLPSSGDHKPSASSSSAAPNPSKAKLATVFLSQEQNQILKLVEAGDSVFYTGSAGTGKSVLLREIIKVLRKKYIKSPDAVAITASTGIAACNIGGVTIHSFAGIGLGIESAEELARKIRKNKKAAGRWARTKVLIVDEVSMVDGDLFDKLATISGILRKGGEPFGGIQLIVTGDFFQLPPVTKGSSSVKFAFEAEMWSKTLKHTFNLTKVFRQSDQRFVDMLNEMRFGTLTPKSVNTFRSLSREINYDDGMGPTELFPRREDVERSNTTRMSRLQTHSETFISTDGGTIPAGEQRNKMLTNFMAPRELTLRVDAQVMLIKNSDDVMLVNGSMGRVLRFVDPAQWGTESDKEGAGDAGVIGASSTVGGAPKKSAASLSKLFPVVEFVLPNGLRRRTLVTPDTWKVELPSGEIQVSRTQLPLILAWAMSIHKSQGQTLDRVRVDLGKVFEKGQAYVALSRATSLDGLQVLNFDPLKVKAHDKVVEWSKTLSTISDTSE